MKSIILYPKELCIITMMKCFLLLLIVSSSSLISSFFMDSFVFTKWISYLSILGTILFFSFIAIRSKSLLSKTFSLDLLSTIIVIIIVGFLQILSYSFDVLLIIISEILLILFFKSFKKYIHQEFIDLCFICASFFSIYLSFNQYLMHSPIINGAYDNPCGLALSLIVSIISLCNRITNAKPRKHLAFYALLIIICIIALLMCNSRAGQLSGFIIISFFFVKRYRKIVFIAFCCLTLFAIFRNKTESTKGRCFIYATTLSMLDTPKHICFGYGYNGFRKYYMLRQAIKLKGKSFDIQQRADNIKHPLNEFLLLAVDYGVLFPILLILGIIVLLRRTVLDKIHMSFYCALFIFSMVSYPFRYPITWIALAWYIAFVNYKHTICIYIHRLVVSICFLLSGGFILLYAVNIAKTHYLWNQAYNYSLLGRYNKVEILYSRLYWQLNKQPEFIYNYATFLKDTNRASKALSLIDSFIIADYQVQMLKGALLMDLKRYNNAFLHFKLAHEMCPNRFIPLYQMYIVLKTNSKKHEQIELGRLILRKTVKIPSFEIEEIKRKVRNDLNIKQL